MHHTAQMLLHHHFLTVKAFASRETSRIDLDRVGQLGTGAHDTRTPHQFQFPTLINKMRTRLQFIWYETLSACGCAFSSTAQTRAAGFMNGLEYLLTTSTQFRIVRIVLLRIVQTASGAFQHTARPRCGRTVSCVASESQYKPANSNRSPCTNLSECLATDPRLQSFDDGLCARLPSHHYFETAALEPRTIHQQRANVNGPTRSLQSVPRVKLRSDGNVTRHSTTTVK